MSIAKLRANVAQHEYATGLVRADIEGAVKEYDGLKAALERIGNETYTCMDKDCTASVIASRALEASETALRDKIATACIEARLCALLPEYVTPDAPVEEKGKGE